MECGQNYNQRHLGLKVIQLKLIHLNHINISLSQFEIRVSSRWLIKKIGEKNEEAARIDEPRGALRGAGCAVRVRGGQSLW